MTLNTMQREQFLFIFIKLVLLLIGIVILIGGSLFTVALPYMFINIHGLPPFIFLVFMATIFLSVLYFWARISFFLRQVKFLVLVISMLFLVGGGLCSIKIHSEHSLINGALLLSLAITLCDYILVLWIIKDLKKYLGNTLS